MPVRIPPLDPPVAWAVLVVGYLLYIFACSSGIDEQSGSMADDNVEGEEQLLGGRTVVDENEGGEEADARPAVSPLFASDNDDDVSVCEPLGSGSMEEDGLLVAFSDSTLIKPSSSSPPIEYGDNRFALLASCEESLHADDTVVGAVDTSILGTTASMGVEDAGDERKGKEEKKKKKLTRKGKSRGRRSVKKGAASPSKHRGYAL